MGRVTKINLVLARSRRSDSGAQEKNSRKIIEVRKGNKGRELEGNAFPRSYPILPSFPPPPCPVFPVYNLTRSPQSDRRTLLPEHWNVVLEFRSLKKHTTFQVSWTNIWSRGLFFCLFHLRGAWFQAIRGGGGGGKALLRTALGMHNPEVITRTNTQIIQNSCDKLINYAVIEQAE